MAKVVSLPALFSQIDYEPHAVQWQIHRAMLKNRFCVVCAGRRTGKSTLGGNAIVPYAYKALLQSARLSKNGRRSEFWIVGPEYSDGEKEFRVLWNAIDKLGMTLDKPGSYNNVDSGQMSMSLWGGKFQVHVKSAKYPDSLVGEALDGVILAEAAKLKPKVWTKYIRPMLSDYRGWALFSSTPEGRNWFYDAYMRGKNNDPNWWSIRMPSWSNNILFPEGRYDPEILDMAKDLGTEEIFKQEIGAEFTEFVGRVFKNWDEELHTMPLKHNPAWPTYAAVDYGWTNPFVWLVIQVDPWDNVYVLDEFYESHQMIDELPKRLKARGLVPETMRGFYPDPASPGDTAVLEKGLGIRGIGGTGGEVKERIDLIRKWLRPDHPFLGFGTEDDHPDVKPKLFVDSRKCPNVLREFDAYRYPQNKSEMRDGSELPMKKDDHTPEALGRFLMGHFGSQEEAFRARVRKARMSSSR